MMYFLLLIFSLHAFSEIPHDEDFRKMQDRTFYPDGDFKRWIDKHYADLVRLKVPGLKPKAHYDGVEDKKMDWMEKRAKERILNNVTHLYKKIDAKVKKTVGTYYYRKGTSARLLVIVPVPHLAYPSEYPSVMRKVFDRYPKDHIIFLENFRFINGEKFRDEKELARVLREEMSSVYDTWKLKRLQKNFFVICNATPYVNEFFSTSPELYDRVIYFSPMVKNLDKGRLFEARELHGNAKTFSVFDLFYTYFVLLKDERVVPLFWAMKDFFRLDRKAYDYYMGLYDSGLKMDKISPKYLIVGADDPLVPPRNSRPELFREVNVIKKGDHLSPLNEQLDELFDAVEKYMDKKDQR